MIDKSIRQHYQTGDKVKKLGYDVGQKLISPLKEKYIPEGKLDIGEVAKTALTKKLTGAATKKLAGTGILSSLGPIGTLLAMFLARKGVDYASGKIPDIKTSLQAFQTGFGSPEEQRELRQLEARRQYMLQRKAEGKNYSEKNLDIVTRAIAEAKGLDINNPNEMKNIDKPITQIRTEKSITEPPQIIPEEPEVKSPFAKPIPKTPVTDYESEAYGITPTTPVRQDPDTGDASIAERIAAENRAAKEASDAMVAKEIAAAEAFRADKEKQEELARQAKAYAEAQAAKLPPQITQPTGGGNGGGQPQTGGGGYERGDYGGRGYHWAKGGRVDKALGGRSRDIG